MRIMISLNLLCFGDSITAGYSQGGATFYPYAHSMLASLRKSFPSTNVTADVEGLPGDQVVSPPGGFIPRMDILYEELQTPYSWAIILGGTNDLNNNRLAPDIYAALQKVWAYPLNNNTKVLALTVPECGSCPAILDGRRDDLNEMILEHEAENFYTFDLHSEIPYWTMPVEKRKRIWDDGVHFTEKGYDLMGRTIADRLLELTEDIESFGKAVQKPLKGDLKTRSETKGKVDAGQVERLKLRSGRVLIGEV